MHVRRPAAGLVVALATWVAEAQGGPAAPPPGRIRVLGVSFSLVAGASVFTPASSRTREAFRSRDWSPELRPWRFDARKGPAFDWDLVWRRFGNDDRTAQFLGGSAGVRFRLTHPGRTWVPYVALRGGPHLANTTGNGLRARIGGNGELGASVASRVVLSARYDLLQPVHGFNVSGYSFRVLFKVF
ncbi:MAG TPA: hypothetical protein VMR21_08300 [Vicinamibacteria bacterium]|nr:hypothetical protein [Vicinamibacteria bacterium]